MAYEANQLKLVIYLGGKKMKVRFPFQIRQAMQIGFIVAEEIENNTSKGYPFGQRREKETRPILMSIRGRTPTFHFEGGLVVYVNMVDLDKFTESWRTPHFADWVVTHVEVRYGAGSKTSEIWESDKLLQLKQVRPWSHPHVRDRREIKGIVGVFMDYAAGDGYIEVDPEYRQSGHYTMCDSVEYMRLFEDDLERARREAEKILAQLLTVNSVAVFNDAPSGEAYYEVSPWGNYKGNGRYVTEYPFDPAVDGDRERAINEAKNHVEQLLTRKE